MLSGVFLLVAGLAAVSADTTGLGQGFYLPALSLVEDNGYGRIVLDHYVFRIL